MNKRFKKRLAVVAKVLEKVALNKVALENVHFRYEEIQRLIRALAEYVPNDQHELLVKASMMITEAQKKAVLSGKK
jgi:uncharacterized protein YydD (DUF2326 family)